jgi:hypothetical protein
MISIALQDWAEQVSRHVTALPANALQFYTSKVTSDSNSGSESDRKPNIRLLRICYNPIISGYIQVRAMPRPKSLSPGIKFEVTLAEQSVDMLKKLAARGIYGRTSAEVGGRFIEQALQQFVERPKLIPTRTRPNQKG